MEERETSPYRTIWIVFIALVALTVAEFFVAALLNSLVALLLIALLKAGLIVYYFMHIYNLWNSEESH